MVTDAQLARAEELAKVDVCTRGSSKGKSFADAQGVIEKGPITRIDIRSGEEIDGFRLYYGTSGIGDHHGGGGGKESIFTLQEGEVITRVEGRSGERIDALQFFTNLGRKSAFYGKNGGKPFVCDFGNGKYLRTISGRASDRIIQADFQFGLPFFVTNFRYDFASVPPDLKPKPELLLTQELVNATSVDQTALYKREVSISAEKTFSFEAGQSLAAQVEFEAGLPLVAEGTVSITTEVSFKQGVSTTDISTQTEAWEVPVTVPPRTTVIASTSAHRYELEAIPFSYDIVFYEGDKSNIVETLTFAGTYEGVNFAELRHEFVEHAHEVA